VQEPLNLGDLAAHMAPQSGFAALIEAEAPHREVRHAELDDAANRLSCFLRETLTRLPAAIALIGENSIAYVTAYLAILRAGGVVVPINYRLPEKTVRFMLEDANVAFTLADRSHIHLVPDGMKRIELSDDALEQVSRPYARHLRFVHAPRPGDVAEILYTSGSTGRPKGVPLTHAGQLWALGHYVTQPWPAAQCESTVIAAPLYHMNGLFTLAMALLNGMRVVLMRRFEARRYLELIADHRCTVLVGIPSMFALMAREEDLLGQLDLGSVTRVIIGSAPLTDALIARVRRIFPDAAVRNSYGTTEAGPAIFGDVHPRGVRAPELSLGVPFDEVEWRLVDGPSPQEGVLHVRTPALFVEYLNMPDVTRQKMRDGWYDTGDIFRRDAEGFFHFVGRADDMFVCGGENVYPGEVEKLIERHPRVVQAAVVAVPDEIKGHIPIAFVVVEPGSAVGADEIKRFTLQEGPAYSHPRAVVIRDHLPFSGTHKIDRLKLQQEAMGIAKKRLGR
jgi:long-chain acyl-CoA synthetase